MAPASAADPMSTPPPLVPADVDLRDFAFMPIDVRRLLTSETWMLGSSDVKAAAMSLWLESWHQVPAGSVPDNDRILAHLSQAGRAWPRVREHVMRGWVKCDDGRFYHPVVVEKARESWERKQLHKRKRETDAERLKRWRETKHETDVKRVSNGVSKRVSSQLETRDVAERKEKTGKGKERYFKSFKSFNTYSFEP
jgi:hypothetical protein